MTQYERLVLLLVGIPLFTHVVVNMLFERALLFRYDYLKGFLLAAIGGVSLYLFFPKGLWVVNGADVCYFLLYVILGVLSVLIGIYRKDTPLW